MEKIGNIGEKEKALEGAGVTRMKYMRVIGEALVAVKMQNVTSGNGDVRWEEGPDVGRRQWGAEMAAKLYNDMGAGVESMDVMVVNNLFNIKRLSVMKGEGRLC